MSTPPPPILPPRYALTPRPDAALLGKGGASTVWRAQDLTAQRPVALKVLRTAGASIQARLEREAAIAAGVVHANVIALHDMGRTPDGLPFLALALANDGSLLQRSGRPLPWSQLRAHIVSLLRALAAMHARGLLHLDVKLSNLLLHRDPGGRQHTWLADLGIARAVHGDPETSPALVGTITYMPAERLTGQVHLWGPSTDLFSVGAVIYRLVTGEDPFPARNPEEAMAQRLRPPTELIPRKDLVVPPGLDDIVLPLLQPDLRSRYDSAADVLRAILSLAPVHASAGDEPGQSGLAELETLTIPTNPAGAPETPAPPNVPLLHRPAPRPVPTRLPRPAPPPPVPQTPALLVHREIPLIGRQDELRALWRAARFASQANEPVIVAISGAEGAGASRLVEAFTRTLEEAGLAEGVRMEYAVPEGPDRGLRGAWRRIAEPGTSSDFYQKLLTGLLARDRQVPLEQVAEDGRRLADWIEGRGDGDRSLPRALMVEHLALRSWRGLSWLWLDDAWLADQNDDCWTLVDQLMEERAPVLVLITHRADRVTPSLIELATHHPVRGIKLPPLGPAAAHELVSAYLPLEHQLSARLAAHTRGNPGYLRALLLHWIRQDQLQPSGPRWALRPGAPPLPADRTAFARERLRAHIEEHGIDGVLAASIAGRGVPARVLRRVLGEDLDRLEVEGLVRFPGGHMVWSPAEAAMVMAAWPHPRELALRLHRALAESWEREGTSPAIQAAVGRHRAAAGDEDKALPALMAGLQGLRHSLPVAEVVSLARQARAVAALAGDRDAGLRASRVLAEALWLGGAEDEPARLLATARGGAPDERARRACFQVRRLLAAGHHTQAGGRLRGLDGVSASVRAELLVTRAMWRAQGLDPDGAMADLVDALAGEPQVETELRAGLLRTRLIAGRVPALAWHEGLKTIDLACDHGLLRHELLAWGLVADAMFVLGRGDELLARLRAGQARLVAHGDERGANEVGLLRGRALWVAGRPDEARRVLSQVLDRPRVGLGPLSARTLLAIIAAQQGDLETVRALAPSSLEDPTEALAWAWLTAIAAAEAEQARVPANPQRLVLLDREGLVLGRTLTARLPEAAGQARWAQIQRSAAAVGLEPLG